MKNNDIFNLLKKDKISKNIVSSMVKDSQKAEFKDIPDFISDSVRKAINEFGINRLYKHQDKALKILYENKNLVLSTGVSSGKSLVYQISILEKIIRKPNTNALLLFPTKALTQDQFKAFLRFSGYIDTENFKMKLGIYDGDTPTKERKNIKNNANVVFSNPDMLHLGILPHHQKWNRFFSDLEYIVIDEVHIYRGIFGSHFANVLRRLKRIARYYGSKPKFVLTSATLSNIGLFIEKLIEDEVEIVSKDFSASGQKTFIIYNPPLVNRELGIRRSAVIDSVILSKKLVRKNYRSLLFTLSRRSVEILLSYLRKDKSIAKYISGYRSGYLPQERRKIESDLKKGRIKLVVSTNALELGIDIGKLDCVLLNGYPGSIASTIQQAGRAGRKEKDSTVIFIATTNLLDQYIVNNPQFVFDNNPEKALINPNNPIILFKHIECALFELPFKKDEKYGNLEKKTLEGYLKLLQKYNKLYYSKDTFFWKSTDYPAHEISLRTAGINQYNLISNGKTIGLIDGNSAFKMVHPHAIYLHSSEQYIVKELNIRKKIAYLEPINADYFTVAQTDSKIKVLDKMKNEKIYKLQKNYGQIKVNTEVVGFKKRKMFTNENLGYEELKLPKTEFITMGMWIIFAPEFIKNLEKRKIWDAKSNYYGPDWKKISEKIKKRDNFTCQYCHKSQPKHKLHVHHKIPFKKFSNLEKANNPNNLVTLCPQCHRLAEKHLYLQTVLAGLAYLLRNIAPLELMCDKKDLNVISERKADFAMNNPAIIFYDNVAGGIGLAEELFSIIATVMEHGLSVVNSCECADGCPACVGAVAEYGLGAKENVKLLLEELLK